MHVEPILEGQNLTVEFPIKSGPFRRLSGTIKAVNDVSFRLFEGETLGIVGESGCGKTTTGRCLMRILDPTSGKVIYRRKDGQTVDIATLDRKELPEVWREIRMIFQDPQSSLNPRLTVLEIIGQSLRKHGVAKGRALEDRVTDMMARVGLRPEYLRRYPNEFSGGQRQRISIARALALHPRIVIADEAVSALDVSIQAQTLNLMRDLQRDMNLTYVFISHDLAVVEHICDRVAVMYMGEIVETGPVDDVFANPSHPYTRALLSAVPVPNPHERDKRKRVVLQGDATSRVVGTGCQFAPRCPNAVAACRNTSPPPVSISDAHTARCLRIDELAVDRTV